MFIKKIFGNPKETFNKLNELENIYDQRNFIKKEQRKTRFGTWSKTKGKSNIFQDIDKGIGYINEKDRFNIKGNNLIDFVYKDKEKKERTQTAKLQRIRNVNKNIELSNQLKDYLKNEKNQYSQIQRAQLNMKYNYTKFLQNEIIE